MKPIFALITAMLGGVAAFAIQNAYFPPRAHAAPFVVPAGPDWRQQVLDHDPGSAGVDHAVAHLTSKLELRSDQAQKARTLLEQRRQRILTLLLTAPPGLTRNQFMAKSGEIMALTRRQLDSLLTPDQRELAQQLRPVQAQTS